VFSTRERTEHYVRTLSVYVIGNCGNSKSAIRAFENLLVEKLCVVRKLNKNGNFVELYSIVFKLESAYF
jgi:hypothetical protein